MAFCGGVCCVSNKLADLFPKAGRFKRGELSAIHPQQGRLLRADRIVRAAPGLGSRVRRGCRAPSARFVVSLGGLMGRGL